MPAVRAGTGGDAESIQYIRPTVVVICWAAGISIISLPMVSRKSADEFLTKIGLTITLLGVYALLSGVTSSGTPNFSWAGELADSGGKLVRWRTRRMNDLGPRTASVWA